jgi:hypothetical protein
MTEKPIARPYEEWHEDDGPVLWWKFPVTEAPYVGTPLDLGFGVRVRLDTVLEAPLDTEVNVGGWPGYHTHWTPLPPIPDDPEVPF